MSDAALLAAMLPVGLVKILAVVALVLIFRLTWQVERLATKVRVLVEELRMHGLPVIGGGD